MPSIKLSLVLLCFAVLLGNSCRSSQRAESDNGTGSLPVIIESQDTEPTETPSSIQEYTYKIMNTFPHDSGAFTQGLVFNNGVLYESTGLKGQSSLRKVDLESGKVLQIRRLAVDYFGEGICVFGDTIVQLTWQEHKGFVYDKSTFELLREFDVETEGWGITTDGKHLIMSDGTSILHFLSPDTFENIGDINVQDVGGLVTNLNELEYIGGSIYANVWNTDKIAIIDPASGWVNGWVDLQGLLPVRPEGKPVDVLNGIAYDVQTGRFIVSGKYWPSVFEIKLVREQ